MNAPGSVLTSKKKPTLEVDGLLGGFPPIKWLAFSMKKWKAFCGLSPVKQPCTVGRGFTGGFEAVTKQDTERLSLTSALTEAENQGGFYVTN